MTVPKEPPKGSRFVVAVPGSRPKRMRFLSPYHKALSAAREQRKTIAGPSAIYKLTWLVVPQFIEGDRL